MTPEQQAAFDYTMEHFKDISRQNRFPENDKIDHDAARCVVCHPELLPMDPFETVLTIITEAIKIRRPSLNAELVDLLNNDLVLMGEEPSVTMEALLEGEEEAVNAWKDWVYEALDTGLSLLSIHSPTAPDLTLEDGEEAGMVDLIERKMEELMEHQRNNAG